VIVFVFPSKDPANPELVLPTGSNPAPAFQLIVDEASTPLASS
jgi:hypothetical protein